LRVERGTISPGHPAWHVERLTVRPTFVLTQKESDAKQQREVINEKAKRSVALQRKAEEPGGRSISSRVGEALASFTKKTENSLGGRGKFLRILRQGRAVQKHTTMETRRRSPPGLSEKRVSDVKDTRGTDKKRRSHDFKFSRQPI